MIAISPKNLSSLFLSPNSFLCKSNAHLFPSIHFFSTSRIKTPIFCPEIYDVLVKKHQFSPELVLSLPATRFPKFRVPERADSFLSFLKSRSFTTPQLEKIVKYNPRILGLPVESLESRLKVFEELGLSSDEIAKIFSSHQKILNSSLENRMIPSLSVLKRLLRSNDEIVSLLKKCPWFVSADLEKTLIPNVEIFKSCGVSIDRILQYLRLDPRSLLNKPDNMRKSVDRAMEIGFPLTSANFIYAVKVFSFMSEAVWEVKLQTFRDLGFSDGEIFEIFRKQPTVFAMCEKKMKHKIDLLLATGKYNVSSIVASPVALGLSVEKRIEPRMQIMRLLESRNLIEKWPTLSSLLVHTDDKFVERYIRPYYAEIGEERITERYIPWPKGNDD